MIVSPIPWVLKPDAWPGQDRRQWEAAFSEGDLFDDHGPFAGHADGTRRLREQCYGQWLSFLARTRPGELSKPPVARVTRENVEAFDEESRQRLKNRSIENLLLSLLLVARAFDPKAKLDWLRVVLLRVHARTRREGLRPPIPISARELWEWAIERLGEVESDDRGHWQTRAVAYRQALTIALLIAVPVRRRAFVAMTTADHLSFVGDVVRLRFSPQDMKTGVPLSASLPAALTRPMKLWLDVHRPALLRGRQSDALWITRDGNDMTADTLQGGLAKLTEREFGIALRPHAFRHIAATSIAEEDPARAGTIRDVLGHATLRTSEMHYNRATSCASLDRLQDVQAQLRKSARKRRPRTRRER